jgi:hypothetical protein
MHNECKECFNIKEKSSVKLVNSKISLETSMKEENKMVVQDTVGKFSSWEGSFGYRHINLNKNWHFARLTKANECSLKKFWENMCFYFKRYD